jgi:flagellar biosynthesis protein FlhG
MREAVARRPPGEASVVAIGSGKGGTGKSFLATNLAVALSRERGGVMLVDCDFGMANDHLLLGVNPPRSLQHFLAGTSSLADICLRTPFGPWLVPGGSGISRLGELSEAQLLRLGSGLGALAADAEVLILDGSAGISPQGVLTMLAAPLVLVVTNPEIAALTDAYALIKCLSAQPETPEIGVVVNRVAVAGQGEVTFRKLADVSRRFCDRSIHYLGAVPEEPAVSHLRLDQAPLVLSHPTCPAARAVLQVLESLRHLSGRLGPRRVVAGEGLEQRFRRCLSRHRIPG